MILESWKKKRDLIRHYDSSAKVYDSLYSNEQNLKIKTVLDVIRISSSDLVLDAGCGTGFLFDHIGESVNFIVGLDFSKGLLEVSAKRSKHLAGRSAISLIRADADHMPFRKEIFDKVFALTLFQNLPDFILTLREIMRVTKRDSTIVITGLKKSSSREDFAKILSKADLKFFFINDDKVRDYIAICRKNEK